jgi:DNA repair photolyase
MTMEHTVWLQGGMSDADEQAKEAYQYFMRMDPDMRDIMGPIEEIDDPVTGKVMRVRDAKIAMHRNPKAENLRPVRVYLDPLPHIRLERGKDLQGWYTSKHNEKQGSRTRPCMTDAILTQPYGGWCAVGCTFCYINSGFRGYRGSGLISVPIGYGDQVRFQLSTMKVATAGYFSSFTDPFLPLEDYYHNTQRGATAFVEAGLPIFFLSRLSYPGWAYDLLTKNKYSYMQKSINTPDEDDWKKLSPGAITLAQHFDEIREAHKRGVIVKFVEANIPWAKAMVERVTKRFGDNRAALFRDLFVENQSGAQRTVTEAYRREGHERYRKKATALGLTYSLCYEYTKKTGVWQSMGPEYITSDQCHGQRCPIHLHNGSIFKPLSVCPPSGCLTCADDNEGKPRCGSELLGQAKALRLADLRTDPWRERALLSITSGCWPSWRKEYGSICGTGP